MFWLQFKKNVKLVDPVILYMCFESASFLSIDTGGQEELLKSFLFVYWLLTSKIIIKEY